jgi:hypothetical protein
MAARAGVNSGIVGDNRRRVGAIVPNSPACRLWSRRSYERML